MASSLETPPAPGANAPDLHAFEHHWQDEADAAFLYDVLAKAEPDAHKRDLYRKLSEVEERHVEIWGALPRAGAVQAHGARTRPCIVRQADRARLPPADAPPRGGARGARVSRHASR